MLFLLAVSLPIMAVEPVAVATFECLGLYWKPVGAAADNPCTVRYRAEGTATWRDAMPLWYDGTDHPGMAAHSREYRGSIVGLSPGTRYEIRLTLTRTGTQATCLASTWSQTFPVLRTVTVPATAPQPYVITQGGSAATGYVVYTSASGTVLDGGGVADANVVVNAPFVILRGLTMRNARVHGVRLGDVKDVIVDDCDISGWGRIASDCPFGVNLDSAVYSNSSALERIVIQGCRLHHPRSNANAWTQSRPHNGGTTSHPIGPQAISFLGGQGRYVIRRNRIWSDADHKFNDGMGETKNFSYGGFPNRDSDIHDNDIANVYDDGAEIEGADMNVRVWSNRFDDVYGAIGAATSSLGPLYVWRNVMASSRKGPGSDADSNRGAYMLKLGTENSQWCYGSIFFFHNTMLQPPARPGFTGTSGGAAGLLFTSSTKLQYHVTARNNILYVRSGEGSVRDSTKSPTNTYDYDLYNGYISAGSGNEAHGIRAAPRFDTSRAGLYPLVRGTSGHDAGVRLPNFNDGFAGAAPDMGAFEATAAPVPPPATPATAPRVTSSGTATILSGTGAAGTTVTIYDHGVAIGHATADGSGAWSWTASPPLATGGHVLDYTLGNAGGTSGHSPTVTVTVAAPPGSGGGGSGSSGGGGSSGGCGAGSAAGLGLLAMALFGFRASRRR